ncbi:MAG TPA: 2-oxoglutarate dehydrogenase, E2 component, dihydrolipoamide succinyltransferase, partial [Planctomycetota bacterium]|nr:2-oxoglutarate dehydrogenase, E2 component, dihydrolipoamide succinyltransferase [Planctomycetota bacterium]
MPRAATSAAAALLAAALAAQAPVAPSAREPTPGLGGGARPPSAAALESAGPVVAVETVRLADPTPAVRRSACERL